MTDNEALTRLFQSKRIPPKLWNYCDQAHQFNFVLSHVPCIEKPADDYLSRLDIRPEERIPSSSMTNFQSTTLRSTCQLKPRSKMRTKRTTYPMMTPPPQNSTMPSTPYWTKFPKATTNRVNSFERVVLIARPLFVDNGMPSSNSFDRETIRHQITPIITGHQDEMTFTRFINSNMTPW